MWSKAGPESEAPGPLLLQCHWLQYRYKFINTVECQFITFKVGVMLSHCSYG